MSCMKKITKDSESGFPSSLNLFKTPLTNVAISKSSWREFLPINSISNQPFTFRIYGDNLWVDLSKIYIQTEFSCEKQDDAGAWTPLDKTKNDVAPIQNIGRTFIRQLKVTIGNDEVFDSGTIFPYRAYLMDELGTPFLSKQTAMQSGGYFPQRKWDAVNDEGFKSRALMAASENVQVISRLEFDMANQGLFLLNHTNLMFMLYRANDEFLMDILGTGIKSARLKIHSLKLFVRFVEVQPSLNLEIYKMLENKPIQYATKRTEMRSCFLTGSRVEFDHNLFVNLVPRKLVIGMVDSKRFNGNYKSPFKFEHFDVEELTINALGQEFPSIRYSTDFAEKQCVRPFLDLYDGLGQHYSGNGPGITFDQFLNGWTIFLINLSSSDEHGGMELVKNSPTNIHLKFHNPIPEDGVELICLAEFDAIYSLDKDRRVFSDLNI